MLEENLVKSMIKSDGHVADFFERPIAGVLGVTTLVVWTWPFLRIAIGRLRARQPRSAA